jgi:hypothetical protein
MRESEVFQITIFPKHETTEEENGQAKRRRLSQGQQEKDSRLRVESGKSGRCFDVG